MARNTARTTLHAPVLIARTLAQPQKRKVDRKGDAAPMHPCTRAISRLTPSPPRPHGPPLVPHLSRHPSPSRPRLSSLLQIHTLPPIVPPFLHIHLQERKVGTMAGTGPEYAYPVTGKDEPIPVVSNEDPVAEAGAAPVVGEEAPELNDRDIAEEERLETRGAGEWSEDMASNEPLPGEEVDPDLAERLPSDRG